MTAPETSGQAAYDAYLAHLQGVDPGYGQWVKPFDAIDKHDQAAWEAAAAAAIAAAAPAGQPSPEVIRAAFRDFLASQGYEDNDRFDQDEMELAFETGMYVQAAAPAGTTGAPVCPGCRQPFDPAKGCIRTCACIGPAETTQHPEQPQAAPELAAAMAETAKLRQLVAEILGWFRPSGVSHAARVGQIAITRSYREAGLPVPKPATRGMVTAKQKREPGREINLITDDERDQR